MSGQTKSGSEVRPEHTCNAWDGSLRCTACALGVPPKKRATSKGEDVTGRTGSKVDLSKLESEAERHKGYSIASLSLQAVTEIRRLRKEKTVSEAAAKVRAALEFHLARRDTNNGKAYCGDCDGNQRRDGTFKHDPECVVSVAIAALKEKKHRG